MVIERADYHSWISAEFSCTPTSARLNFIQVQGDCGKWIAQLFWKENEQFHKLANITWWCVWGNLATYWLNNGICCNLYQRTNIKHFRHQGKWSRSEHLTSNTTKVQGVTYWRVSKYPKCHHKWTTDKSKHLMTFDRNKGSIYERQSLAFTL